MSYVKTLTAIDQKLAHERLAKFVPNEVYDIHAHPYAAEHFPSEPWSFLDGLSPLGCREHRAALQRYMPSRTIHGLYFGMPRKTARLTELNRWVGEEVRQHGTPLSRALRVTTPACDPAEVASAIRRGDFCGMKVYHCYSGRADSMNAKVEEYVPEWMWEILHENSGVLMLHIVRDGAMEDHDNQQALRRLCRKYSRARLILAHVGRSFNYRNARAGLRQLADLDNAVVDTSAVAETEAFRAALESLGPRRVLWGSDFAVSELRGRCVTTGENFFWLHPEVLRNEHQAPTTTAMTLVGIESLLCLREACEDGGLNQGDIDDIFLRNALRNLSPHLPPAAAPVETTGQALWQRARTVISGGTGLLSKRAEMFDAQTWPAYFSVVPAAMCGTWKDAATSTSLAGSGPSFLVMPIPR